MDMGGKIMTFVVVVKGRGEVEWMIISAEGICLMP